MYLSFFLSLYIYIYIYKLYTPVSRSNCLSVSTFCLLSFHLHLSNCSLPACLFFLFVCLLFICVPFSQSVFTLSLSLSLSHTHIHTHSFSLSVFLPASSVFYQSKKYNTFSYFRITRLFHF